jgi:ATP-dependent Lon protease
MRGSQGDPKAALLEVLDPEQNSSFMDHYLDTPIDLSNVLFVCTANSLDGLPQPLLDRMEVIEISGYTFEEKAAIAAKYLEPTAREHAGLKDAKVKLQPEAIDVLIKHYCRESGVRNLKKQIEKVYRKVALKIVSDYAAQIPEPEMTAEAKVVKEEKALPVQDDAVNANISEQAAMQDVLKEEAARVPFKIPDAVDVEIGPKDLQKYVGVPIWVNERLYEFTPPGVVMGLSVNPITGMTFNYVIYCRWHANVH